MEAIEKIEAQQAKLGSGDPAWMVGEQLKDICRREPGSAELIGKDLDVEAMSLTAAAGKIKAFADKQPRKGNCVCVPPNKAEEILREFYGLGAAAAVPEPEPVIEDSGFLSLDDYL